MTGGFESALARMHRVGQPNSCLLGLHVDRRLIGCLRLQVGRAASSDFPALEPFSRVLQPLLIGGKTLVHMSCVATHSELAQSYVWLPYPARLDRCCGVLSG